MFGAQITGKTTMTKSSFLYRAVLDYNIIPVDIRTTRIVPMFKKKLRRWVEINISVH